MFLRKKSIINITGKNLYIRSFTMSDINKEYISWLNDSDVVKFSNQRFVRHNKKSCKDFFKSIKISKGIFFLIIHKAKKENIGTMTVRFSKNHKVADISILIGKKNFWGQGLGKEGWYLVMNYLLKKKFIRKVTGGTLSCNKGMVKIFKKTGMVLDGVRKNHELVNNKPYNIVYYAKFNS
jgi:RimJ/RimL family protein N-acetyltransferase